MEKLIETQETLNNTLQEIYDLNLIPEQKLAIQPLRVYHSPDEIIQPPLFDARNIYCACRQEVIAFKKRSAKIRWKRKINHINDIVLLDANRLLVKTSNGKIICLNRETGLDLWQKECNIKTDEKKENKNIKQIYLNRFQQLDSSLLIIPSEKKLVFLNNMNGDSLFSYQSQTEIKYISEFDVLEKSLYIVEHKKIKQIKLELKIK